MPRNVEIKARVDSLPDIRSSASRLATEGPTEITQDDTFFRCEAGRLKLRAFSGHDGELIFYRRATQLGPKESFYVKTPTADPDGLRDALTLAFGQAGRVMKHRTVFLVGRTRVHLDSVVDLGSFVELEVVLADGESAEAGVAEAKRLMAELGIQEGQLIDAAYVDLMPRAGP